jgi:hypothetical protein
MWYAPRTVNAAPGIMVCSACAARLKAEFEAAVAAERRKTKANVQATPVTSQQSSPPSKSAPMGLELPKELGPDTGKVHLDAVFANHTREQLLAMCGGMPIE